MGVMKVALDVLEQQENLYLVTRVTARAGLLGENIVHALRLAVVEINLEPGRRASN